MKKILITIVLTLLCQSIIYNIYENLGHGVTRPQESEKHPVSKCSEYSLLVSSDDDLTKARHLMYDYAIQKRKEFEDEWVPHRGFRIVMGKVPHRFVLISNGGPWDNPRELRLIHFGGGVEKRKGVTPHFCSPSVLNHFGELKSMLIEQLVDS